jgi:hypothetical protein
MLDSITGPASRQVFRFQFSPDDGAMISARKGRRTPMKSAADSALCHAVAGKKPPIQSGLGAFVFAAPPFTLIPAR